MDNAPTTEADPAGRSGMRRRVPMRPLLVGLVLVLLVAWQWFDTRARIENLRQDFAKHLASNDALLRDAQALAKQNQEAAEDLEARLQTLESTFAEAQSQQVALESMYQEISRTRDERIMAEVEQSISIAAQQLQLAGNVETALIALNGADVRLARTAQPQYLPLRKLIARDIARLTAMPVADISGMAVKIESIVAQVDDFPMAFDQRLKSDNRKKPKAANGQTAAPTAKAAEAPAKQSTWWQLLLDDLRDEITPLIRVERIERSDPGLLPPTQAYFLRENIKLRLINARLALVARDSRSFREDAHQVTEWLERYFDTQSPPVAAAVATMKSFSTLDIVQQAPSLNETLAAVRNFKVGRK